MAKICVMYIKNFRRKKYFSKVVWDNDLFFKFVNKSMYNIYRNYIEREKKIKENIDV